MWDARVARAQVDVPNRFTSVRHWCEVIGHNLLAEFYYEYQQAAAGGGARLHFTAHKPTELTVAGTDSGDDNFVHNLLLINRWVRRLSTPHRLHCLHTLHRRKTHALIPVPFWDLVLYCRQEEAQTRQNWNVPNAT